METQVIVKKTSDETYQAQTISTANGKIKELMVRRDYLLAAQELKPEIIDIIIASGLSRQEFTAYIKERIKAIDSIIAKLEA